jgi:hypothetical protein
MKKYGNMTPWKVKSFSNNLNDSEGDEISNFELKRMITMINKMKEDMNKHLKKPNRIWIYSKGIQIISWMNSRRVQKTAKWKKEENERHERGIK